MKLTANPAWLSLPPNLGKGSGAKFLRIMKLTTIIILAACLHASAKGVAQQTITFSGKEVSLERVFSAIKKQTNYRFFFNTDMLSNASKVTLEVKNAQVEQVMNMALKDQPLTFTIKGRTIFVMKKQEEEKKSTQVERTGDPITVSGQVTDDQGQPLVGANVKIKGSQNGITTDNQGRFTLANVDPNSTLEISFVGHETEFLPVKGKTVFSVALGQRQSILDETVVIAYGQTTRRFSTGNVTSIQAKDIEKQPVNNPLLALQGRVPGLEVIQTNGIPGGAIQVKIRGLNSFNNGNDPLYVIDGVPYISKLPPGIGEDFNLGNSGTTNGRLTFGNPLSLINPQDIESISVLKDADATAIYGSRAANGAILITTKKKQKSGNHFEINVNTGWGRIARKVPLLNLRQYLDMRYEAYQNDGTDVKTLSPSTSNYDLTLWDTTKSVDWQDKLIGNTAKINRIQLSYFGGSNNVNFLISPSYSKETTVYPGDYSNEKASLHFNVASASQDKKFQATFSGNFLLDNNNLMNDNLYQYIFLAPNSPDVYNDKGELNWGPYGTRTVTWVNPYALLLRKYKNQSSNLLSNLNVSYSIIPGLKIMSSFGYTNINLRETSTLPQASYFPGASSQASAKYTNNSISNWIIEPQLSYKKEFGTSSIELLAGATLQSSNTKGTALNGSGYLSDSRLENISAASITSLTFETDINYKYAALFSRIRYDYKSKYIINLSSRRDGTSRFGPEKRFHNFYSIGSAWVFSNEKFISQELKFLSLGKFRFSYGITGSDQVQDYKYLELYNPTEWTYQGVRGISLRNLYNPILAWESTRKLEAAMEIGLFNDRIYFSGSYFKNRSSNQLTGYKLSNVTGFNSIDANQEATVENKGIELLLNVVGISKSSFRWSTSINYTAYKNKMINASPTAISIRPEQIGKSINSSFLYKFSGVNSSTGIYEFIDKNGTSIRNPDTLFWYDMNPKFYGGIQNSITFKGFEIDFLFQFVKQIGKNSFFGAKRVPGSFSSTGFSNQPVTVLDRWQKAGDDKPIQKFNANQSYAQDFSNASNSSYAYPDASYIRLKNISVSYRVKTQKLIFVKDFKIYSQAQNIITISKYKGSDPESLNFVNLPPLKVFTIGIQASF